MDLASLEQTIAQLSETDRAALVETCKGELERPWIANPGPQTEAMLSEADILLYGGAAGGGKTDLLIGCAAMYHSRSLIVRRQSTELDGIAARSREILTDNGDYNKVDREWSLPSGSSIKFGGMKDPDDWRTYAGRARDLIGFDEAAEFLEEQVSSLIGWLRSVDPDQRCRVILASNPPRGADGMWLVKWFAPWLDPLFHDPAKDGEIRWAYRVGEEVVWVDGPGEYEHDGESYTALSRTFIPARLDDNPYLKDTNYRATLQSLPEPLRSQLLKGDFMAGREDDEWQVIPSTWVQLANERWEEGKDKKRQMVALSADIAQGGRDDTVLAPLYAGAWFGNLIREKGIDTKDGKIVANLMIRERRDGADLSADLTGGWGGGTQLWLQEHHGVPCYGIVASAKSGASTQDGRLHFKNLRAELWWKFREALDPESGEDIALPPDQRLTAQLCAPHWKPVGTDIKIEEKEEIKKRLGSSTDDADAVIQAWSRRQYAILNNAHSKQPPGGWHDVAEDDNLLEW